MKKFRWTRKKELFLAENLETSIRENGHFGWKAEKIALEFVQKFQDCSIKTAKNKVMKMWFNRASFMAHKYGATKDNGECPRCVYDKKYNTKRCFWGNLSK